jgi:hypothetical protein
MVKYLLRAGSTAYRIIDGTALIVGGQIAKLLTLNDVGTFIWQQADGRQTMADITKKLCQEFDIDQEVALRDAEIFVRDLQSKNLLTLAETPRPKRQSYDG